MTDATPICYSLTRRQRLIPHLKVWGPIYVPFAVLLLTFFAIRTLYALLTVEWLAILVFGGLLAFFLLLLRGLVVGLIDVLFVPIREMNVTIENNGLGVMLGESRWYIFLDGIQRMTEYVDGLWTIEHWNGSIVHIPKHLISSSDLAHIRERMAHGRTTEGFIETVERGRIIQQLTRNDRHG